METPEFNPREIYIEVTKAGDEWADCKAAYELLDDATKSVLADVMGNYMDGKCTKTEAERLALSSRPFRDHLASLAAARKEWLKAQVKYDGLKMLADMRRSQESTRRAEMRL